jgi:hypothetical protein
MGIFVFIEFLNLRKKNDRCLHVKIHGEKNDRFRFAFRAGVRQGDIYSPILIELFA